MRLLFRRLWSASTSTKQEPVYTLLGEKVSDLLKSFEDIFDVGFTALESELDEIEDGKLP